MNKLVTTIAITLAIMCANATQISYREAIGFDTGATNKATKIGVSLDDKVEIKDLKYSIASKMVAFAKTPEIKAEVDDYLTDMTKDMMRDDLALYWLDKAGFPKYFAWGLEKKYSTRPVTKSVMDKYGVLMKYTDNMSANDIISIINANEIGPVDHVDRLNKIIKNAGVKYIKKYLRSQGKTFVTKIIDGKEVNPLETPMKELTDSLNAAKYAGFNEWISKYNADWTNINISWLPDSTEMRQIMDDILIDEKKMNNYSTQLRIYLGVDAFNAFVKEYNEGSVQ